MNRPHDILTGALCLSVLATAFCLWSAFGNEVNLCVTAGCTLYQDSTIAGISLWWLGTGVFTAMGALALLGAAYWGRVLAGAALLGDVGLLLLMALTTPCINCLVVAVFFALLYASFRQAAAARSRGPRQGRSALLVLWGLLFVVNLGAVARSQADVWPLTDNGDTATVHMYFSPSCPSCREGVETLSGHVDVAFYPLAENEADVHRVAQMARLLDQGMSMAEALSKAHNAPLLTGLSAWGPDMLQLRFRMLRNKAHVFTAGAQGVPFFEYHGLPSMLKKQDKGQAQRQQPPAAPPSLAPDGTDAILPLEPQTAGQCGGPAPCP